VIESRVATLEMVRPAIAIQELTIDDVRTTDRAIARSR